MYENDNSMPTRGLTDYKDVQSIHVDIDSVAIAANKLQAFQCNRFEPFKINVEGHLQTCLNSKLLDSLGIKSQQPVQEFYVGGQGEYKIFAIVKSSIKPTKVGPYATKEGKLERIENEHNWFIQNLVLKSIQRLKKTSQTWQMCPKKVTPDSHQKRSITIYPSDWDDFVCLFDHTVSGDPNAPFKMNATSRYVFYRCSHGLKIRDLNFCIQNMAHNLIRDRTLVKCIQIHVGFVVEPHENNAAYVNLDNVKKLGDGSQSRYQQYFMYRNLGFFSGMTTCTLGKEIKYVNAYNPSHHILDPHKSSTVYAGAVTGFCSAVPRDCSPKYGLSKTTFPADFSSKLDGYESYAQVVANKSSCRMEFVLEVTPDLLFRKTDSSEWLKCLQQRQNLQNLSRYVALPTSVTDEANSDVNQSSPNFHINCEPKTFLFLFVKKVEREILRLQLISVCGNYKQYGVRLYDLANELRRLVAVGKSSKPITKSFVRTVYDVEHLLRFFIEGYHPLRVDINRLDRLLTDVNGLALLPKPHILKIRSELLALIKLEPISLREQTFPFPRMINQIEWLFSNLPDFHHPDNKIYTFFRLLCIYSVQFCGCEIPTKTYLDPRQHLTVDFVDKCKTKDLRWTTIYTAQEVTDRLMHPRTVIGQMLASCCFTDKDIENADIGAAVFEFVKSHVDCIPAFIVEGHEIVHKQYAWGQIATKRGSDYRILQEFEDSNVIQPPLYEQRTVQSIKTSKKLFMSGALSKQRHLKVGTTFQDQSAVSPIPPTEEDPAAIKLQQTLEKERHCPNLKKKRIEEIWRKRREAELARAKAREQQFDNLLDKFDKLRADHKEKNENKRANVDNDDEVIAKKRPKIIGDQILKQKVRKLIIPRIIEEEESDGDMFAESEPPKEPEAEPARIVRRADQPTTSKQANFYDEAGIEVITL